MTEPTSACGLHKVYTVVPCQSTLKLECVKKHRPIILRLCFKEHRCSNIQVDSRLHSCLKKS